MHFSPRRVEALQLLNSRRTVKRPVPEASWTAFPPSAC